jgi:hypothetical protein
MKNRACGLREARIVSTAVASTVALRGPLSIAE